MDGSATTLHEKSASLIKALGSPPRTYEPGTSSEKISPWVTLPGRHDVPDTRMPEPKGTLLAEGRRNDEFLSIETFTA